MSEPILYVIYRGTPADRFDRAHYVEHHLPLVRNAFAAYGLVSLVAFFPVQDTSETIAICECRFTDAASIEVAFSSPEVSVVMADVPCFTDLEPLRMRALPL
ncbi:MAG: EthD family reductase [Gluconobacter japonicus]|uniref:EthD family reductase n=1 Tax=Gluconobacter japonicus TaxID=376620 RepID=UPI0039E7BD9C